MNYFVCIANAKIVIEKDSEWQFFMERHSKGEFHVLVKELKQFDHEFFFKNIATWHLDFSQQCLTMFFNFF